MTGEVYIMRIWQDSSDSESCRVILTDTQGGQKYTFATLDQFVAFFEERLEDPCTSDARNEISAPVGASSLLTGVDSKCTR